MSAECEVFIAGAFVTPFGKFVDRPLRSHAAAVAGVLADAGGTPDQIDAVFFANSAEGYLTGQECIRVQVALQGTDPESHRGNAADDGDDGEGCEDVLRFRGRRR